jgi:type IV pilus assembly protein PilO
MSSLEQLFESLRNFDYEQLNDLDNVGSWPLAVKFILWILIFAAAIGLGYFVHITNLQAELQRAVAEEKNLRNDYETNYFQAAHLASYRIQQKEMEETFESILRQLPSDTEIPGLIEDITLVGLENGLEFTSIDLQPEVVHEFYIEKPIQIVVSGDYHSLGSFVSDVSDLSRIVTLHDFTISPKGRLARGDVSGSHLNMVILAKTYRYNDQMD